jgi:regulator of cell morphogenesis and NO signaling
MESEHEWVGKELTRLRDLTNNYTLPEDACNTYRTAYKELEYFEEDIHKHIHLENNILHPGAIELENKLFSENEVKI